MTGPGNHALFASRPFPEDIVEGFEKVFHIGRKRVFLMRFQVFHFVFLNIPDRYRGGKLCIERGDEAGLNPGALFLQFLRIKTEVMMAQWADAHDLHFAFEDIQEHGKFVNP